MNQAQLLQDTIYYPDVPDAQQWLIYYISKPLVGSPEPLYLNPSPPAYRQQELDRDQAEKSKRPEIKGFADLLNNFPVIARQMQPGLEKLFQQFLRDVEATPVPAPTPTSYDNQQRPRHRRSVGSFSSLTTLDGAQSLKSSIRGDDPLEDHLRHALESLVFGAIDLFQGVEKQQLSLLGSSTDLSGSAVERMIEQYVTEHFHSRTLFPSICRSRREADEKLDSSIKYMTDLDILQVGADLGTDDNKRRELSLRLSKGVETFKKIGAATSPQEMIAFLLDTEKCIMSDTRQQPSSNASGTDAMKPSILTNADLLVSMLLLVVIRSGIRNLHARLFYMLEFLFVAENESGEVGYALSTYEAVLSYLANNASCLRRASQTNRSLWRGVRKGDLKTVKQMLERDEVLRSDDEFTDAETGEDHHDVVSLDGSEASIASWVTSHPPLEDGLPHQPLQKPPSPETSDLKHVFPFQIPSVGMHEATKVKKRVSMDTRSMSSSSAHSQFSQASTARSTTSMKLETSVDCLAKTRDPAGASILMMAVEKSQSSILQYLLHDSRLFTPATILDDCNDDGTTLMQAALQVSDPEIALALVDYLDVHVADHGLIRAYLARQDHMGRSAAHYLFNAPTLIPHFNANIPWLLRDKHGQTPLFAMCRSYDHHDYIGMVESAIDAAAMHQPDGGRLHLDLHADNKRNTLLHVANHPKIIRKLLWQCDSDPNVKNDKQFTPLMVASKFARLDSVRIFFNDERTDLNTRDQRGLSAVELAKDDEVRNRIDDMVLLTTGPAAVTRTTTIVRSYFVEDGTIRLILKSGAPTPGSTTVTVTTCRRSPADFENLARWLILEHPASYMPSLTIPSFRSPFQLTPRPSRAVLCDSQLRLNAFLKVLLAHPTFATHEMLWEFFLVPDISPAMLAQRSQLKATLRVENLRQEHAPVKLDVVPSIELFVAHASDQLRAVDSATSEVTRRVNTLMNLAADLGDAQTLLVGRLAPLDFLPPKHQAAMVTHCTALQPSSSTSNSPLAMFHHHLRATLTCTSALLTALARSGNLIASLRAVHEQLAKHEAAAARSAKWPSALGLLDDARRRLVVDAAGKAEKCRQEAEMVGRELSYTRATVAGELAGWWETRGGRRGSDAGQGQQRGAKGEQKQRQRQEDGTVKAALRELAKGMVVREKERLQRFRRAGRAIGVGLDRRSDAVR